VGLVALVTQGRAMRALVAALVVFFASPVLAFSGDKAFFTGISYERIYRAQGDPGHGMGSHVGFRYMLADDWTLLATASYAAFIGPEPACDLGAIAVGVAYLIDAVSWVPDFFAGAAFLTGVGHREVGLDLGLLAGMGLEYRPFREFGVGARGEYRMPIVHFSDIPGVLSVGVYVVRHFL